MTTKLIAILIGSVATTQTAAADEPIDAYAWSEPRLASRVGVGITLGGGLSGFTDQQVRDAVDSRVGGAWAARVTVGTHTPLGIELSYTGTSVDLRQSMGTLTGTNVEGALRWNIFPHDAWNPYAFAGAGWQRYDVSDAQTSGIRSQDDLAVFPLGAGLAYRDLSGITFDARGTFRPARGADLVVDATGSRAELHTWEASGNIGYEF
jgi:hypothetical protein